MSPDTIAAIIAALGVREIVSRIVDAWRGSRGERRSDTQALWDENRKLRDEVEELSRLLMATREELVDLRALIDTVRRWMPTHCPYDGERCMAKAIFGTPATRKDRGENGKEG